MFKSKSVSTLVAFILLAAVISSAPAFCEEYKTYKSENGAYSIDYPPTWRYKELPAEKGKFKTAFISPRENPSDKIFESFVVMSKSFQHKVTIDQFYEFSIPSLEEQYKILDNGTSKLSGIKSRWIILVPKEGSSSLITIQHFVISKGRLYIITTGIEKGKEKEYVPVFKKILASFKIQ